MINFLNTLLISLALIALSGCSAIYHTDRYITSFFHEEVVFIYTSSDYPNEIYDSKNQPPRQTTLIFGPYQPNIGDGGGGFGGNNHSYKGPMDGKEIVALWQVPLESKTLRYYVRSEANKGIIKAPREGKYTYKIGVALGPMRARPTGLTEKQHISSDIIDWSISGKPILYRWGEWGKLYYATGIFDSSDLMETPRKFHEIQAIAITAEQYDKLYERCHSDWREVKCFMDESFPDLTPEQLDYIQARKHPDDDDRLAGKFPKPERRVNRYK
jgi:hypothetical protein